MLMKGVSPSWAGAGEMVHAAGMAGAVPARVAPPACDPQRQGLVVY